MMVDIENCADVVEKFLFVIWNKVFRFWYLSFTISEMFLSDFRNVFEGRFNFFFEFAEMLVRLD